MKGIKFAAVLLSALTVFLLSALTVFATPIFPETPTDPFETAEEQVCPEISAGIYKIKNAGSEKYLDVFDLSYDPLGQAYLENASDSDGQLFLLKKQDNGRFLIIPQSESGLYNLGYSGDIMLSDRLVKHTNVTSVCEYDISACSGNAFSIKPSGMNDPKLSLGVSSERASNGTNYACIMFDPGNDPRTEWTFEKVSDETLRFSGSYVGLCVGKSVSLRSRVSADYLLNGLTWYSSDPKVATVDFTGKVTGTGEGVAIITVRSDNAHASCTVNVTETGAYTWYSQHNIYGGGWDAEPVAGLRITTSYGLTKTFFINNYNKDADWMDEGCKLCSEAMVLHNLGATMTGYDVRYDITEDIEADPYTVMLANIGASGYDVQDERPYYDPIMIVNYNINSRFKVNGRNVSTGLVVTSSTKMLRDLLEIHPEGVIVEFNNYGKDTRHFAVFTECLNPDDPDGDYIFKVCDSSAMYPEDGDNVLFTDSYMYKRIGYRFFNMTSIQYYIIED